MACLCFLLEELQEASSEFSWARWLKPAQLRDADQAGLAAPSGEEDSAAEVLAVVASPEEEAAVSPVAAVASAAAAAQAVGKQTAKRFYNG
jgi:hypothetical protein